MYFEKRTVKGTFAGLAATIPMTASMLAMYRWLPWWQQASLPPHEVTSNTLDAIGLEEIDEKHHKAATLVGHFFYGAVTGSFYPLVHKLPAPTLFKGILFGLGVWAISYLGWLPAADMLEPANQRPLRRNLLMIVAHAIWGTSTGILFERFHSGSS